MIAVIVVLLRAIQSRSRSSVRAACVPIEVDGDRCGNSDRGDQREHGQGDHLPTRRDACFGQ
jgi:hypothetical protein